MRTLKFLFALFALSIAMACFETHEPEVVAANPSERKPSENPADVPSIAGQWKIIEENDAWDYTLLRAVDDYRVWEFFPDGTVKHYHDTAHTDARLKTFELKSDSLYIYYDNVKGECCTFIYGWRFTDAKENKIEMKLLHGNITDIPQPLLWIYERVKR
ncbi:MAG: hypothetical protein LBF08_08595 [Dysgonamonadaceae bacterium]|jgi:hypothetical protein|nr:hypothetical protein [Dysgonamonadaceae bacterium]